MNVHAAPPATAAVPRREILGVDVAAISEAEAKAILHDCLARRRFTRVGFLNAHVANLASADPALRKALAGFLVLSDGAGVDLAAKLLHGKAFPANLNGTDFVPEFLRACELPLSVGLVGARPGHAAAAASALARISPQHRFRVFSDGFFSPGEEPPLLQAIAAARPDVLLVAMGVPRQEMWIGRALGGEHCTLAMGVGALFDFLAGAVPRAPLWMRQARLEWAFRLGIEPRRMWRRYVVGNPLFLARVLARKVAGGKARA